MFSIKKLGHISDIRSGTVWTPQDLRRQVARRLARLEALGLRRGDRIVIAHEGTPHFFADLFAANKRDRTIATIERLAEIAAEAGITLTRLILEWTLRQPGVDTLLAGIRRPEHLPDAVKAGSLSTEMNYIEWMNEP